MPKYVFPFLFLLVGGPLSRAQCGELFIYRPTGLQGEEPVYLFQDGVQIARLGLGDRYRAVVCQPATYFFDVRFRPGALPVSKAKVFVGTQDQVYLKVNLPPGMELPTINQRPPAKAQRDLAKGNRFRGPVQTLSLRAGALASTTPANATNTARGTVPPPPPAPGGGVGNVQIVDNFRFELTKVIRVGDMVRLEWKITNLAADDRLLAFCPNSIHFYDPSGNLLLASKTCLINSCSGNDQLVNSGTYSDRYPCHYRSEATMPANIPVNASAIIRGVSRDADRFVRGKLRFKATQVGEVGYTALTFPDSKVDPLTRRYDDQLTRYLGASKQGQEFHVRLRHTNGSTQPYELLMRNAKLYDEEGRLYEATHLDHADGIRRGIRYGNYPQSIPAESTLEYTLVFTPGNATIRRIPRLSINFNNYIHEWQDLEIASGKPAPSLPVPSATSGPSYVTYRDFTTRVSRGETVAGQRIILEKLYFDTGSSDLLPASYPQLDELAKLLQQNPSLRLEVSGHTDATGEVTANLILSQRRADEIRYYLIGKQIDPARVTSVGKGESSPVDSNATATGRAGNRRVEILVLE